MKSNFLGILLLAIGLLALLGNFGIVQGEFFLIIVGIVFLTLYGTSTRPEKQVGFLIPGCLTLGLGLFTNFESYLYALDGSVFFLVMGGAFAAIYVIHNQLTAFGSQVKWALFVGLCMLAFGAFVFSVEFMDYGPVQTVFKNFWPIALIAGGVYMITSKGNKRSDDPK